VLALHLSHFGSLLVCILKVGKGYGGKVTEGRRRGRKEGQITGSRRVPGSERREGKGREKHRYWATWAMLPFELR